MVTGGYWMVTGWLRMVTGRLQVGYGLVTGWLWGGYGWLRDGYVMEYAMDMGCWDGYRVVTKCFQGSYGAFTE